MRKFFSIFVAAIMTAGCFAACTDNTEQSAVSDDSLSIVTTIFPEYDWVMNVLGDNPADAEVTMLLDNGVDLHSYQPTADDIMKIATCDLFIYVGGESDEWVEDALAEAVNPDMVVINLLDELGNSVYEEEVIEGMEAEEEEEEAEGEEEIEYDEHVWLSLRNAQVLTSSIEEALEQIDPDNASIYEANADAYIASLNDLDARYEETVDSATADTLVFADRFPFRYLTEDYDLNYYAAFVGCSAETEASFETITFLAGKVDELGLTSVMTIEGNDHSIAETVISNASSDSISILTMDSMQSTTSADVSDGTSYLSIMENNLTSLNEALNPEA